MKHFWNPPVLEFMQHYEKLECYVIHLDVEKPNNLHNHNQPLALPSQFSLSLSNQA